MKLFKQNKMKLTREEIDYLILLLEKDTRDTIEELLDGVRNGNYDEDEQRTISREIFQIETSNHQMILKLKQMNKTKLKFKLFK